MSVCHCRCRPCAQVSDSAVFGSSLYCDAICNLLPHSQAWPAGTACQKAGHALPTRPDSARGPQAHLLSGLRQRLHALLGLVRPQLGRTAEFSRHYSVRAAQAYRLPQPRAKERERLRKRTASQPGLSRHFRSGAHPAEVECTAGLRCAGLWMGPVGPAWRCSACSKYSRIATGPVSAH